MQQKYEVHSTITFAGYRSSVFAVNLCAQKLKKAQTKRAKITGVKYNSRVSTWSGVNFVLTFLLLYLCANSHPFTLSVAAAS